MWQTPGCTDDCALRLVIVPGLLGYQRLATHDPTAHEQYGKLLAGDLSGAMILESGPLRLDRRSSRLVVDDVAVTCSATEWGVLLALVDANDAVVARNTLLKSVWGPRYAGAWHILRVTMARLRSRLGAAAGLIETVPGLGYRFRFVTPGAPAPARKIQPTALRLRGRWARDHDACRICGSVERQHQSHGYCSTCAARVSRGAAAESGRKRGLG